MRAADALFDAEFAAAYGVEYTEDPSAPANEDSHTTANVDRFLAARHAWMEAHLPLGAVVPQAGEYGGAKLLSGANRHYSKPGTGGAKPGLFLDERTGRVETIRFTLPAPAPHNPSEIAKRFARGGDDPALALACVRQRIPLEVDFAPLGRGAEHAAGCGFQPFMGVAAKSRGICAG